MEPLRSIWLSITLAVALYHSEAECGLISDVVKALIKPTVPAASASSSNSFVNIIKPLAGGFFKLKPLSDFTKNPIIKLFLKPLLPTFITNSPIKDTLIQAGVSLDAIGLLSGLATASAGMGSMFLMKYVQGLIIVQKFKFIMKLLNMGKFLLGMGALGTALGITGASIAGAIGIAAAAGKDDYDYDYYDYYERKIDDEYHLLEHEINNELHNFPNQHDVKRDILNNYPHYNSDELHKLHDNYAQKFFAHFSSRKKRDIYNREQIIWKELENADLLSRVLEFDKSECCLRLVCELAAQPEAYLHQDEIDIVYFARNNRYNKNPATQRIWKAAELGLQGVHCSSTFETCPFHSKHLMDAVRRINVNIL